MSSDGWDDSEGPDEDRKLASEDIVKAVVTDTDWTTETILSQLRRGNIQLNPRFQRRDAWDRTRKSRFIESLILGLPIPQIVLAEDKRRRGKFIVLDGKQRLLALRQFAVGSEYDTNAGADEVFKPLALTGLDVREDLRRMTLSKLEQFTDTSDLDSLLNQTIRTVVVRSWPNEEFLNLVFLRLNTGSVKLSPQELRQALHPGGFTDYLDDFSAASEQLQAALRITKPDFRMRDVEVMLRFFAFNFFIQDYASNLKRFLDDAVDDLNKKWESDPIPIEEAAASCEAAVHATFKIFGDNAFYRWSGSRYEGRFNRAVFDIMTYYFCIDDVRQASIEQASHVEEGFRRLCSNDRVFVEHIQSTTKTSIAVHGRLARWGAALEEILPVDVPIPELINKRIVR